MSSPPSVDPEMELLSEELARACCKLKTRDLWETDPSKNIEYIHELQNKVERFSIGVQESEEKWTEAKDYAEKIKEKSEAAKDRYHDLYDAQQQAKVAMDTCDIVANGLARKKAKLEQELEDLADEEKANRLAKQKAENQYTSFGLVNNAEDTMKSLEEERKAAKSRAKEWEEYNEENELPLKRLKTAWEGQTGEDIFAMFGIPFQYHSPEGPPDLKLPQLKQLREALKFYGFPRATEAMQLKKENKSHVWLSICEIVGIETPPPSEVGFQDLDELFDGAMAEVRDISARLNQEGH